MKIKLLVSLSGTRNGVEWPPRGEVLDVPGDEGADLCAAGIAEPVASKAKERTATAPDDSEQRKKKRP